MRTAFFGAAALVAAGFAAPLAAQETADDQLAALADEYQDYRLASFGFVETESGATRQGDALWSVTPEAWRTRAAQYRQFLSRLDALEGEGFSNDAKTDALVLRTLLESEIGDAQFSEWQMPFNSDSNFWSYLTPGGAFGSVEDYEAYI
ncbi:MAG: DUF885 domain-containing protein, partial [Erythrobacter sp.]|nr:DUF885 domain-containing protein [Erythrobacter sp.]